MSKNNNLKPRPPYLFTSLSLAISLLSAFFEASLVISLTLDA